jgi:phosphosulfolactate phosphohydrolase-like enzyme
VLVSVHDRCTVCAKRIMGSEIILDTTNGTPR